MKYLSAIPLLFSLQFLTTSVVGYQGQCDPNAAKTSCPENEYCYDVSQGIIGSCMEKRKFYQSCSNDSECVEGSCYKPLGKCTQQCTEHSECGSGRFCLKGKDGKTDSACAPKQSAFTSCSSNEQCESNVCFDSQCSRPILKGVGEGCNVTDSTSRCNFGSVCEENVCRSTGVEYRAGSTPVVTNEKCNTTKVKGRCSSIFAYCDHAAGDVCRAKKYSGQRCDNKDQCQYSLCGSEGFRKGFCLNPTPGGYGDPCSDSNECKNNLKCLTTGDGVSMSEKTCAKEHLLPSKHGKSCSSWGECDNNPTGKLYCYQGKCLIPSEIQNKGCENNVDCGGIKRELSYDISSGDKVVVYLRDGFECNNHACSFIDEVSSLHNR